jgi:hypothetical protein
VRLEDVAPPIQAAMFSSRIDPATPGLVSSLVAQVSEGVGWGMGCGWVVGRGLWVSGRERGVRQGNQAGAPIHTSRNLE